MATIEGSGESNVINIDEFLKNNKLQSSIKIFKDRGISVEELIEMFDNDGTELKEFAMMNIDDGGLNMDLIAWKRLKKGLMGLMAKKRPSISKNIASKNVNTNEYKMDTDGSSTIKPMAPVTSTIVVTPQEHEAIQNIYKQYDGIQKQIIKVQNALKSVDSNSDECKKQVNAYFDEIVC